MRDPIQWTPDGSRIAYSRSFFELYSVGVDGSERQDIVEPIHDDIDDLFDHRVGELMQFDVSPDGSRVAYSTCRYPDHHASSTPAYSDYNYEIVVSNIDGTDVERLTWNDHFDNFPVWSPDGAHIAFFSDPDPTHDAWEVMGRLVIHTVATGESRDIVLPIGDMVAPHPPAWSPPDGRRIAFVAYEDHEYNSEQLWEWELRSRRAVYTVGSDGSDLRRISDAFSEPSWSPDGRRIALAVPAEGESKGTDLYTFAPDGSNPIMVTKVSKLGWIWDDGEEPFWIGRVSWSPDGSDIMFTRPELFMEFSRSKEDSCRVCIAAVDGSIVKDVSALRLPSYYSRYWLLPHPEWESIRLPEALAWSPDGSRIAVRSRNTWYGVSLYTIDRDGKDLRILLPGSYMEPVDLGSCSNGVVVPSPTDNPGLVEDCRTLLGTAGTLGGSVNMQWIIWLWGASTEDPITEWRWVELDGEPPRVNSLDIHLCGIEGCLPVLYGQIPPELGDLAELRTLSLEYSELNGHIPPELGNLANLETLDLSWNVLTGSIPPELGNLANLETLDLSDNLLTGSIPPELGNLTNLRRLFLSENRLTGCIPSALRDVEKNDLGHLRLPDCE